MNTLQTRLQQGLNRIDPWLDAVFPIATALICMRQRLIVNSLLTLFVLLRLLQRSNQQNWRWILILLVLLNAGLVIEDRDLRPGSTSDYLIIAAAFAAGFERTVAQWRRSLPWLASCIVPLLAFSLAAGNNLIQGNSSFTGFNINKLGFLSGMLIVTGYGNFQQAQKNWGKLASLALTALGVWESVLTQSRAAIAAPIIAILIDAGSKAQWNRRKLLAAATTGLVISTLAIHQWYFEQLAINNSSYKNRLSDLNRIETIRCWITSTSQQPRSFLLGQGYGKAAEEQCGPEAIPSLRFMEKRKGLQHAHNLYAQVLAESGIGGLTIIAGLTLAGFRKALLQSRTNAMTFSLPLMIYLFLMAMGITYWQVLVLNQILVGYSLASLSAVDSDGDSEDAPTPKAPAT